MFINVSDRYGDQVEVTIEEILEQTNRLHQLCESLLLLSKVDAGSVIFNFKRVILKSIVQEVVDVLEVLAEEKKQSIHVSVSEEIYLQADSNFLRQALMNIVDNAVKYTFEGEIEINVVLTNKSTKRLVNVFY